LLLLLLLLRDAHTHHTTKTRKNFPPPPSFQGGGKGGKQKEIDTNKYLNLVATNNNITINVVGTFVVLVCGGVFT
jgi:hypothetical protein